MDQHFVITDEYIELNKLLKASGVCDTGGQAKMIVEDGLVTVDGETETRKRRKIKDGMIVEYGDHRVKVVCKKQ
jgi:ribosome-associated protein